METARIRNGSNDIWVVYRTDTGATLGSIRLHNGLGYQVYVPSPVVERDIPQGQPHKSLDDAEADLRSFY